MANKEPFHIALERQQALEKSVECASKALAGVKENFDRGNMGLIGKEGRNSSAYKIAKGTYENRFKKLQTFNKWFVKEYKRELREYRRQSTVGERLKAAAT